ncbi:MAG: hypothetical protein A2V70_03505 [Planctomycetes bacterium RBG_13_63_9]|nr:MAG: hypothetical protein A2V70_03505 [Planctomycetes bacterium RBG_13_63_9]
MTKKRSTLTAKEFHRGPPESTRAVLRRGAFLVADGMSIAQANQKLGLPKNALYKHRAKWRAEWDADYSEAVSRIGGPQDSQRHPSPQSAAKLRQAVRIVASGKTLVSAADALGITCKRMCELRTRWREFWDAEFAAVKAEFETSGVHVAPGLTEEVRKQIRQTTAMFAAGLKEADVAKALKIKVGTIDYWRQAHAALWHQELDRAMEAAIIVVRRQAGTEAVLEDPEAYIRRALHCERWARQKGVPLFPKSDQVTVSRFYAEILPKSPWVKPPPELWRPPRFVPLELIGNVYQAAVCMELPRIAGFKPAAWWRALLVVGFNSQLRKRTLFEMRMDYIRWDDAKLILPPQHFKARRGQIIHLNQVTLDHLRKIRTNRELVFEWPGSSKTYYRCFHQLQDEAGIPGSEHFGLHDLRRTASTLLYRESAEAAQRALGHASLAVTLKHYVSTELGDPVVDNARDRLPQPDAFRKKTA